MIPDVLYKYREDSEFTERVIRDRKAWLSTPQQLNDPLECQTGLIPEEWKRRSITEMEDAQMAGMHGIPGHPEPPTLFSLGPRDTRRWWKAYRKLARAGRIQKMRKLYAAHGIDISDPQKIFATLERDLHNVGIFSLSASGNNQPLWAHYAGNHAGLALGFATADGVPLADPAYTLPVIYADTKPIFEGGFINQVQIGLSEDGRMVSHGRIAFTDPVFRASISTKPLSWSYEQEWRFVRDQGGLHDFPGELVSVTYGSKMPAERRAHYQALLAESGLCPAAFQAVIEPGGVLAVHPLR